MCTTILHTSSADLLCVVVCLYSSHLPLRLLPLPLRPLNSKDSQKPAGWRWNGPSWVWCSSSFYLWWWQDASSGNISCQNFCQVRLQTPLITWDAFKNVFFFFLNCWCCCWWVKNVLKLSSLHVSQSCWVYTTSLSGSMLSINQSLRFIFLSSHNIRVKKNPKQNKLFTESSVDDELRSLTINQSINQSVNQSISQRFTMTSTRNKTKKKCRSD